jgi:hypothetical protein
VRVAVDEESVPATTSGVTGEPDTDAWSPGEARDTELVIVQGNEVSAEKPESSVAVTVTDGEPAVVGVPVIVPVDASIESPAGSPVAE